MHLSERELWALIHGMGLGALFLLAFAGGFAGLWSLKTRYLTTEGIAERTPRLLIGTSVMAVVAWLTVITGTWVVYPWYRAPLPKGADPKTFANLIDFPRQYLVNTPNLVDWHNFGMEWKEHVAWIAPILATSVAFVVIYYGRDLIRRPEIRRALLVLFSLAFLSAGVAGLFGALITKAAPVH